MEHRWKVFAGSLAFLALGVFFMSQLKTSFMPEDVQYWSYIDVWLPNDTNLDTTNQTAQQVEQIVRMEAEKIRERRAGKNGKPEHFLKYVTTFAGGGGPRFWFSVSPQLQQLNYAQIILEVTDKEITPEFVKHLQPAMSASIPGARVDVRQLQYAAIDFPVDILITNNADVSAAQSAEDIRTLRRLAGQLKDIFRSLPNTAGVRDDWDTESSGVKLMIDPDRANLAGITNQDVCLIVDLRDQRASAHDFTRGQQGDSRRWSPEGRRTRPAFRHPEPLCVLIAGTSKGSPGAGLENRALDADRPDRRLDHFRTISVRCFPGPGVLSSEVLKAAGPEAR
jgi:multidrug efflux pump subunit AcrB